MKWLFISNKTARYMSWHKDGVREKDQVMVHSSDSEAWKALDDFDADFARDARNVRIMLVTDGFSPYNMSAAYPFYSVQPSICYLYEI
jgi:hypothetical protein